MLIYIVFLIFILLLSILNRKKIISRKIYLLSVLLFLVGLQGFRDPSVGIDIGKTSGYLEFYNNVTRFNPFGIKVYQFERGFIWFNYIIATLTNNNEIIYLLITSFIIHSSIFLLIYKYSKNDLLSIIMYLSLDYFIFSFSGLRQSIAISIVVLSYISIYEGRKLRFFILVLLASTFHRTAIFALLIFAFKNINIKKKDRNIVISFLIVIYALSPEIFSKLHYIMKGTEWYPIETGAYRNTIYLFILWILSFFIKTEAQKNNFEYNFQSNMENNMLLMALIIQLFSGSSYTINRMGFYFLFPAIISLPRLLELIDYKNRKSFNLVYYSILLFFITIIILNLSSGYLNVYPFKFRRLI